MKTDAWIELLASGASPVHAGVNARRTAVALAAGLPLTMLLMLSVLGLNPALAAATLLPMFWVKLGVPLCMSLVAVLLLVRLGRPGAHVTGSWLALGLPVLALWALGLGAWLAALPENRPGLLLGKTWRSCPECIAMLSAPVFVAAFWVLRGMAPVRPRLAGAGAGALAGATGATVYALHCPEMAAPFLAIWYVAGMAIPVAAGALLGPRLLRW